MTHRRISVALVLLVAAPALAVDQIVLIEGTTFKGQGVVSGSVRGTISKESPEAITASVGGSTVTVPLDQVERVVYDAQSASFVRASGLANGTDQARAAEEFGKAADEAGDAPLVAQAARFGQAKATATLAAADPSQADEAIKLLDAFLKANPESRHTVDALRLLAELRAGKGDLPGARDAAKKMAAIGWARSRGTLLTARLDIQEDKAEGAVSALDRLINAANTPAALKRDASLAKATALAKLQQVAEAETLARGVIAAADPDDAATQALAYNTLGDCLLTGNRPKDALLAYLHTDILFASEKEQHARALSQISKTWRALKRDDRANEAMARLKQQYPRSPWATATP